MITTKPHSDRRLLTFPAIHPCPSISPSTLIASLTALAAEIAGLRSNRFPIFRRAVRESFRETGILALLLDDLRDSGTHVPESAIAGMSELHVALQRLRWLLTDCGRRGARLWMLMNSGRVLSEFRAAARSASTSLDVVRKSPVEFDEDVEEMVGLLARQSREIEFGIDGEDERTVRAVRSILRRFRGGDNPDPAELKRVLDRLDVENWDDCNEEVAFLEEEILEYATEEDGEGALLGSLMGLLIYCRAVLFEVGGSNPKSDRRSKCGSGGIGIDGFKPESFRCPISLELMTDPVTISTGQTYDRASIVRWFKDGVFTCPVTGEALKNTTMVPNLALQKLISAQDDVVVVDSHRRRHDLTKTLLPQSTAATAATRITAKFLVEKLSRGSNEEKNRAAYEIRILSKSNLFHRVCLVEADSVPWLLHLSSSSDPPTQDNAVAALLNISKIPIGKTAIFDVGGIKLVVDAMTRGLTVEVQQNAAAILFYLSSVSECRQEIGEIPEAIPALVNLLKKGNYRAKKNAVVALFGLLSSPGNHDKVLSAGVVSVVLDGLLTDEREDLVSGCVGILAKIAQRKEGANAISKLHSDVLPRIVPVLRSSASQSGKEHSISLLLSLFSSGGEEVMSRLESIPSLMPSLYSIVVEGPPRVSKKARSLINHIHMIYDQDRPVSASQRATVEGHRVIHAL